MCRSWFYKVGNPPFRESGHWRHAVQVANVCSYKLGLKNEFQFLCELGWFLHGQSHIHCKHDNSASLQ